MNTLYLKFVQLITAVAGTDDALNGDKVTLIVRGLVLITLFSIFFIIWYWRYTKDAPELRRLLWWTIGILALVVFNKYALYHFFKDYISNHLIFYALPSPKAAGILWFILPMIIFGIFLRYSQKMFAWPAWKFLSVLWLTLVLFALSVAAMREGDFSIYERFTHIFWEFTGNLPLVQSISHFLHNFNSLHFSPMSHTVTHPPGFTVLLYFFQTLFQLNYLGLSIAAVMFGSLALIPVYFLFKEFMPEQDVRRRLILYAFLPSVVLMGAVTMDFTLVFVMWLAIALVYVGWRKNFSLAVLGGIFVAVALFMNFLVLLLAPFFAWFAYHSFNTAINRSKTAYSILGSAFGFALFFLGLYYWTGYSIVDNFFVARAANQHAVSSNFESIGTYCVYLAISLTEFALYLGIPYLYFLFTGFSQSFKNSLLWFKVGVGTITFLLLIGVFQGETGRLWLFITPFFALANLQFLETARKRQMNAYLALTMFQIVVMQVLFYTDW